VSFDTAVVTGYPAEAEFLCDKPAMFGDTIKKHYITDLPLIKLAIYRWVINAANITVTLNARTVALLTKGL
jgi:hypothetical protein